MLLIVGVVATIVVAVLAWNGRGQAQTAVVDSDGNDSRAMLVADPEIVYATTLNNGAERVWVLGRPGRLAVGSSAVDGTQGEINVHDESGAAMWSATFAAGFTAEWIGDDLLVTTPGGSGGYQLSLLEGGTGAELWRAPTASADVAFHQGALYSVLTDRVSMIDLDDGTVAKSIEVYAAPTAQGMLEATGRFYDVSQTSVQLVAGDLEPLGVAIPTGANGVFAPFDEGTLVATGGELIRYDLAGVEQARWSSPVADIESLVAVNESLWLAAHGQQVTAIELGDGAVSTWSVAGTIEAVVSDRDSGYVAVDIPSGRHAIYRADTGLELATSAAPVRLADNGYYLQTGSRLRTYSLPDRNILYDSGAAPGQSTFVIDGGYVLLREAPTTAGPRAVEITVLA